jgi:hypothetical protein
MALRYPVSPASPSMVCRLESSSHSQSSALCLAARRILVSPMTTTGALHLPLAPPIRSLPGLSSRDRSGCEDCDLGPATTSVPTAACLLIAMPAGRFDPRSISSPYPSPPDARSFSQPRQASLVMPASHHLPDESERAPRQTVVRPSLSVSRYSSVCPCRPPRRTMRTRQALTFPLLPPALAGNRTGPPGPRRSEPVIGGGVEQAAAARLAARDGRGCS